MVRHLGDSKTGSTPIRHGRSTAVSPFVGREAELQRLAAALDLAVEGQGGVMFLTGEPGIGKTCLGREVLSLAEERGFTVLEGRAYPLEGGLAYAPLVDAFRLLLRTLEPADLSNLTNDLPSLGRGKTNPTVSGFLRWRFLFS
ncbi:MAG: DUF2791 family P-loop domain-containing protein [Chloroflexi bacterium]|nr:DUF2791 family P-loop domain-containing protein [Chloroflexota bacterium]